MITHNLHVPCTRSYLTFIGARVFEICVLEPEYPVLRLGHVDDLEPLVVGEQRVTVRQHVKVAATEKRYLEEKNKREKKYKLIKLIVGK